MREWGLSRVASVSAVLCLACGSSQQAVAPAPPAPSASETPPDPPPPDPAPDPEPPPEKPAAEPEPPAPPAEPSVEQVCETLAATIQQQCGEKLGNKWRRRCRTYVKQSEGCEAQTRQALGCQTNADPKQICSPQAASTCHAQFRALKACQRGEQPAVAAPAPESNAAPEGWVRVADDALGISVLLPPGAALDAKAPRRTWQVELDGVTYIVAQLPAPPEKLTQGALVRMVVEYVGQTCQLKLRLHGRYETEGRTTVHYDSGCTDKTEWRGMLRIWDGKAVSIAHHGPKGRAAVGDPYFYSVQHAQP